VLDEGAERVEREGGVAERVADREDDVVAREVEDLGGALVEALLPWSKSESQSGWSEELRLRDSEVSEEEAGAGKGREGEGRRRTV